MYQPNSVSQGLITSHLQISKHSITVPRLELISTYMRANLVQNGKPVLEIQNVRSVTGWTDNTVVLYWLKRKGSCKELVGNRVNKIREKKFINWYYVTSKENTAEIGSKRSLIVNISRVWWEGPPRLPDKTKWPDQPFITSTTGSDKESKCIKELVTSAIQSNQKSEYNYLLSKYDLHKTF